MKNDKQAVLAERESVLEYLAWRMEGHRYGTCRDTAEETLMRALEDIRSGKHREWSDD